MHAPPAKPPFDPIQMQNSGRLSDRMPDLVWRTFASFLCIWVGMNMLVQIFRPLENNGLMSLIDPVHLMSLLRPSQELFALLWILCVSAWMKPRFSRHLNKVLTALIIFTVIFRTADQLVPVYFDRPFNLFIDSRFLPDLVSLLHDTMTPAAFYGWIGTVVIAGAISWILIDRGFSWIQRYFEQDRNRKLFMTLGHLLLVSSLGYVLFAPRPDIRIFSQAVWPRIVTEIGFILHVEKNRRQQLSYLETSMKRMARLPSSLGRLSGRNVYILFIESYGETAFEDPRHFSVIAPVIRRLENDPKFSACSAFLRSPTMTGSSWLAHGTLAGGVMTDTHLKFNLLLASKVSPLAHYFNQAGYRTVDVMPGTRSPRPEDSWFAFQQTYDANTLGYRGPTFGWATMPDQFVLDRICRKEIRTATAPLFIQFILVSSHAAFHLQPPLIDDWSKIKDGAVYHDLPARTFPVVWPDLSNAHEAYAHAIAYDLGVLEGFLHRCVDPDALVIVLGDHQPSPQISGDGPSRSVPIHIISRSSEILSPFLKRGYTPGFIPRQPHPHPGMDSFLEGFLQDFSSR